MQEDVARNPGLLKLDLFCRGIRVDESCRLDDDSRGLHRTRAGLGSGLEVIIPPEVYTNIPVLEKWVEGTPYSLHREDGRYVIRREGRLITHVKLLERPKFYDRRTSSGRLMSSIGVMQGTYLGIYPTRVCHHWEHDPRECCKFCSVGLNLGEGEAVEKTVRDVVELAIAARREEHITYVHFNTGYYEGDTYLDDLEPYITAVKEATGCLIGVQTPPHPDFSRYDRLRKLGVNQVSFCFELWDETRFREVCPGKAEHCTLKRYLDAIEYCAKIFDTTNGEIVAGLEPPGKSIEAIDWMTSVGAIPTVCVFRPLTGTEYEDVPPPVTGEMVPIFRRMYEACMEHGLPLGIAPNIKVSIVLLPDEGRYFLDNPNRYRLRELMLTPVRVLFRAAFWTKLALKSLRFGGWAKRISREESA
ncbi:MAG TPA: radical SAM protein [Planctomycetota bacterium]|nr:radical SAM protein [Planctomycetota bacterium]